MLYYFSLNGVLCCVLAWTFSSTSKSLGGITVILITLNVLIDNYADKIVMCI